MMWNPFRRKLCVCIDDCLNRIIDAIKREDAQRRYSTNLWSWLESKGVKHKWDWNTHKNYLVFESEAHYTMFVLKWLYWVLEHL